MWKNKTFKTKKLFNRWVEKNGSKMQWEEIFVNNAFGVTYRQLRVIDC